MVHPPVPAPIPEAPHPRAPNGVRDCVHDLPSDIGRGNGNGHLDDLPDPEWQPQRLGFIPRYACSQPRETASSGQGWGDFAARGLRGRTAPHLAGDLSNPRLPGARHRDRAPRVIKATGRGVSGVLVRVHSECLTGEVFDSLKCDCRGQLEGALDQIAERGAGVVVYLRQEGRGIGLGNKSRAHALQAGAPTPTRPNSAAGLPDDLLRYDLAGEILRSPKVTSVELLTNNLLKVMSWRPRASTLRRPPRRGGASQRAQPRLPRDHPRSQRAPF